MRIGPGSGWRCRRRRSQGEGFGGRRRRNVEGGRREGEGKALLGLRFRWEIHGGNIKSEFQEKIERERERVTCWCGGGGNGSGDKMMQFHNHL